MYVQFTYLRPSTTDELVALLEEKKQGTILYGGGTDILVDLRAGTRTASRVIDVKNIDVFSSIDENQSVVRIGCAVTLSESAGHPLIQKWAPALAAGVSQVGSVQIRNKATLAGNIQTASPAGDGLNAAYALDGVAVLLSTRGERRIPLQTYITGPRRTQLQDDEVLAFIELPKKTWNFQRFFKVGLRNALAISVVNGAVALHTQDGKILEARICVGAVAPTPLRFQQGENFLRGKYLTSAIVEEIAALVTASVSPISDLRASAAYRAYMAGAMVKRQLCDYMEVQPV